MFVISQTDPKLVKDGSCYSKLELYLFTAVYYIKLKIQFNYLNFDYIASKIQDNKTWLYEA